MRNLSEEKVYELKKRIEILDNTGRLQPSVDENHDFDAFDVCKFFFADNLDLLCDTGINNDEMMEVLLILCQFYGHRIVEDL